MNLDELTVELRLLRARAQAHHIALRVLYAVPTAPQQDLESIARNLDVLMLAQPLTDQEKDEVTATLLDIAIPPAQRP